MAAAANHTPGPWKVFRSSNGKLLGIGDADGGGVTDAFGGLWRSGKEMEANAELVAAAPDLLSAARAARKALATAIIAHSDGMFTDATVGEHTVIAQLDAAIARAVA